MSYPGYHKVQSALAEFLQSLEKGKMWWYNMLRDNAESISHILQIGHISAGYVLLTSDLVSLKRGDCDTILTVKIIE